MQFCEIAPASIRGTPETWNAASRVRNNKDTHEAGHVGDA